MHMKNVGELLPLKNHMRFQDLNLKVHRNREETNLSVILCSTSLNEKF